MRGRARPGFTLIEMIVVMTVGMTVMMLAIGLISRSMQISSDHRGRMNQSLITDRLAREFRRDANQSVAFKLDSSVQFTLTDGSTIEYEPTERFVVRTHRIADKTQSVESFDIGRQRFAELATPSADRIALTIRTTLPPTTKIERHIETGLGRWLPTSNERDDQ